MRKLVLLLFLISLVGGGALLYRSLLAGGATQPPPPVATPTPQRTPLSLAAATPTRVAASAPAGGIPTTPARSATTTPTPPLPRQFELSEQDVTRLLLDGLTGRGYEAGDLAVRLEEGRFTATTSQQLGFFRVPVVIVGEAGMSDGQPSVRPTSITAAGVALPQDKVEELAATMQSEFAAALADLPVRPTSITIEPGKLIVEGVPK